MQIKVYLCDGKNSIAVVDVASRLTKVKDVREQIAQKLGVSADKQRLFYRGKELQDVQSFYDYGINHADVVQLWPRMVLVEPNISFASKGKSPKKPAATKGKSPKKASESLMATNAKSPAKAPDTASKSKKSTALDSATKAKSPAKAPDTAKKTRNTRNSLAASDVQTITEHFNQSSDLVTKPRSSRKSATSDLATTAEPPQQSSDLDLQVEAKSPAKTSASSDVSTNAKPHQKSSDPDVPPNAESPKKSSDIDLAAEAQSPAQASSELLTNAELTHKSSDSDLLTDAEPPKKKANLDLKISTESPKKSSDSNLASEVQSSEKSSSSDSEPQETLSAYFKVGDTVYTRDCKTGEWESSSLISITKRETSSEKELPSGSSSSSEEGSREDDGLIYRVERGFNKDGSAIEFSVQLHDIRLGADKSLTLNDIKKGMVVLANYNYKTPTKPGAWYETLLTNIKQTRTENEVYGIVFGAPNMALPQIRLIYKYDLIPLSPLKKLEDRDENEGKEAICLGAPCNGCKGNPNKLCFECNCVECGKGDDPESQIMCEECDDAYHIGCLDPPLEAIPTEDWYCKDCKRDEDEIVKPGEKLKKSKLKAKMPSSIAAENGIKLRDWGRGNSTMGLTKKCTIVPENHFGPIPGVEVGTCWKWRRLVSESGVHRPPVAGIHGRGPEGAYSLVLSGGYEDDEDKGTEFYYTGAGGRDLSGNKRCSVQSFDQELTQTNLALARNCHAPINDVTGGIAKDWTKGRPVRVVRGFKLAKHSKFAPKDGLRYDGCYKVVSYQPKTGKSGFKVWQYLLRRDDPTPAPWTPAGIKHIKEHGLDHVIDDKLTDDKEKAPKSKKRKASDALDEPALKVPKLKAYKLDQGILKLIKEDKVNEGAWESLLKIAGKGKMAFMAQVRESFLCPCCQELASDPINTTCLHIVCKSCLQRSYSAGVFSCPTCRTDFTKSFIFETNTTLSTILTSLFPGYNAGR